MSTAQELLSADADIAGLPSGKKKRSQAYYLDQYTCEFALYARKLRKNQPKDAAGNVMKDAHGNVVGDKYATIVERSLTRIDAILDLLDRSPQLAEKWGSEGLDVADVLELVTNWASEEERKDVTKEAVKTIQESLPSHRVNKIMKAQPRAGGIVFNAAVNNPAAIAVQQPLNA